MKQPITKAKPRQKHFSFWLPLLIICLLAGCVWLGYQQFEAQKRNARLFQALRQEDLAAVQRALDSGANPNSRQSSDYPATDFLTVIKRLFSEAIHPSDSQTALSYAAGSGNAKIVQILLNHGALPNLRNGDGSTALMAAADDQFYGSPADMFAEHQKHIQIMQILLSKGADINAKRSDGSTALTSSASINDDGTVALIMPRFLLEHGADANAKTANGGTLLQWAVDNGDKSMDSLVGLLLNHGANVDVKDTYGWTPMMRASELMEPTLVETLLTHGANPNFHSPANDMTPLIQAARQGQLGVMKLLLDKGADVNAFSKYDSSALFVATQQKHADIVKFLLERGANPNYINGFEMQAPALVVAASNNDVQTVKILLAHGANVNLRGQDDTPLTAAASRCLVSSYANRHNNIWNPSDISGMLPVAPPCSTIVPQTLIAAGADANQTDQAGNTALIYAVAGHNTPLVRLLLSHGANPLAPGNNPYVPSSAGETPLSLATQRGYSDLIPILRQNRHSIQ